VHKSTPFPSLRKKAPMKYLWCWNSRIQDICLSPNTKVCAVLETVSVHKGEEGIMLVPPGSRFSCEILADSCELYISTSEDVELVEISSVHEFCEKFVSLLEHPAMQYH
jgi:hypothetical protein